MKKALPIHVMILLIFLTVGAAGLGIPVGVQAGFDGQPNAAPLPIVLQTNALTQVNPSECPSKGCAAGQRINFSVNYVFLGALAGGTNTQVCIYAPANDGNGASWIDSTSFAINSTGTSGTTYTQGETSSVCSNNLPSNKEVLAGAANSNNPASVSGDSLGFVFRISRTATLSANATLPLTVKVFELDTPSSSWTTSATLTTTITVAQAINPAYVANDIAACGNYSPCFVNSGDDSADGIGTGLKDAIDALTSTATLNILGNYTVKSKSVTLNQADILQGMNNATITSNDTTCAQGLITITAGATIQNLNLNAGPCTNPSRDLIDVDSPNTVTIASNNLTNGNNAISIADNTGNVLVQFNQIQNNLGYGILRASGSGSGKLSTVGNNISGNRAVAQVECNNNGSADHNYWGPNQAAASSASNCTVSEAKRLGAPILANPSGPGVDGHLVTVTDTKTQVSNLGISVQHSSSDVDFGIYILNHGHTNEANIPFLDNETDFMVPCGNFLDIFLDGNSSSPNELDISFAYALNPTCNASIGPAAYCNQTIDAYKYPLWWFNPQNDVSNGWETTGTTGANTTCSAGNEEITVAIKRTGHPDLVDDLNFTPFFVGLFCQTKILQFNVTAGIGQATLHWETAFEKNIAGFYIVRSLQANSIYSRTGTLQPSNGNATMGAIYNYLDTSLDYGTSYFYKLEFVDAYGNSIGFYGPISAITASATPTITSTPTITLTPTRTVTPTITKTFTQTTTGTVTPVPSPTRTWTPYIYYTYTPYRYPTWTTTPYVYHTSTPLRTATLFFTWTPFGGVSASGTQNPAAPLTTTPGGYPQPVATEISMVSTSTAAGSAYPQPTLPAGMVTAAPGHLTPTSSGSTGSSAQSSFWISLVSGGVLGLLLLLGTGWLIFQQRFGK